MQVERLRKLRRSRRLTLAEVAEHAGISPSLLSRLERGEVSARLPVKLAIAAALDVPVTDAFPGTQPTRIEYRQAYGGAAVSGGPATKHFEPTPAEVFASAEDLR